MKDLEISRVYNEDELKKIQTKDGGFESLLGETSNLIQLIAGDYMLFFDIQGEVRIGYLNGERCFDISKDEKLQEEIRSGNIFDSDNYNVWDNNWFEVFMYKGDSEINGFVYEDDPKTIEDLFVSLEEYFIEEIKENVGETCVDLNKTKAKIQRLGKDYVYVKQLDSEYNKIVEGRESKKMLINYVENNEDLFDKRGLSVETFHNEMMGYVDTAYEKQLPISLLKVTDTMEEMINFIIDEFVTGEVTTDSLYDAFIDSDIYLYRVNERNQFILIKQ